MNEFSPSELIYLYIDGEADAGQQAALFAALAHDSELQAEFNDAFALRLSVSAEVRNTVPVPALKQALFQKAGFSYAATVAPVAPVVVAETMGSAAGWMAGVKSMMIPLLASLSGVAVIVTSAVLWLGNSGDKTPVVQPIAHSAAHDSSTATHFIPDSPVAPGEQAVVPAHSALKHPAHAATSASGAGAASARERASDDRFAAPTRERISSGRGNTRNHVPNSFATAPTRDILGNTDRDAQPVSASRTPDHAAQEYEYITQVRVAEPEQQMAVGNGGLPESVDGVGTIRTAFSTDESTSLKWAVGVRGLIGLRLFPWREMGPASDLLDNTAVGALWEIDNENAAGVEFGREVLPMYVADSDGELRQEQTLFWSGVIYRYTPETLQLSEGLQPFTSVLAGGSALGPLLKTVAGIAWTPDSRIRFTLGAEGTFLLYRYQQEWYGTQKLGVSYGVSVTF